MHTNFEEIQLRFVDFCIHHASTYLEAVMLFLYKIAEASSFLTIQTQHHYVLSLISNHQLFQHLLVLSRLHTSLSIDTSLSP